MKIIQILPELQGGGVERGTLELGKYLSEQGHESLVVSHGGRMVKQLEEEGSRHITMPVHKKSITSLPQIRKLRNLFEIEQPDIIHVRSRLPAWLTWLAWRKMNPSTRPRFVTTVHGFYSVNRYSEIMTYGEKVICVSESVKEYVLKNYPSVPEEKLVVIYEGVDPEEFPYGYRPSEEWLENWYQQYPQLRDAYVITLPGRITRLKGHHDFLDVIEQLRSSNLPRPVKGLIVGGEDPRRKQYAAEIRNEIKSRNLDSEIMITGHRQDMKEIYAVSSVVVSLSQQPESFGKSVLEALSTGVPVVGYDHGGVSEVMQRIFPRGLVPVGETSILSNRVQQLLNQPERIVQPVPFDLNSMFDQSINTYKSLLSIYQQVV